MKTEWPESFEERRKLFLPIWIKALRSGKYSQTAGQLRINNHFCCLGVACDLGERENWDDAENYIDPMLGLNVGFPSSTLLGLWGVYQEEAETLAKMNDYGEAFEEIANYIEREMLNGS